MTTAETTAVDRAAAKNEERPTKWICPECKSDEVEEGAWVKVNSDKIVGRGPCEGPSSYFWCEVCQTEMKHLDEVTA